MTEIALPFKQSEDLSIEANLQGDAILLKLQGTADMRVSDDLHTILDHVHQTTLAHAVTQVVVDITRLEFMNSSCFKSFVTWVAKLQELDTSQQYRLRFLSDPQILWQRRSLHALSCFAMDLVSVEALAC